MAPLNSISWEIVPNDDAEFDPSCMYRVELLEGLDSSMNVGTMFYPFSVSTNTLWHDGKNIPFVIKHDKKETLKLLGPQPQLRKIKIYRAC